MVAESGVEANVTIRNAGAVRVPDEMTSAMPKAAETYKIGITQNNVGVDSYQTTYQSAFKNAAEKNAGVDIVVQCRFPWYQHLLQRRSLVAFCFFL